MVPRTCANASRLLAHFPTMPCRAGARFVATAAKSYRPYAKDDPNSYDAVVIGGGHNGLVAAGYLQKSGLKTAIFERRHVVGGAAVTEEIVPGFKFSRCSYLLSPLRDVIIKDFNLNERGLRVVRKSPSSFTPCLDTGRALTLGSSVADNMAEIKRFSESDAISYERYEKFLRDVTKSLLPIMDNHPTSLHSPNTFREWWTKQFRVTKADWVLASGIIKLRSQLDDVYQLFTAPIESFLRRYFDTDILKATLATDALVGTAAGPSTPATGFVLLHHIIGSGWGFVEGGMGSVTRLMAEECRARGVDIFVESPVSNIVVEQQHGQQVATAIQLENFPGRTIKAKTILSNCTPHVTFERLTPTESLPPDFLRRIRAVNYRSPSTKINVAVSRLPMLLDTFKSTFPVPEPTATKLRERGMQSYHQTTLHLNASRLDMLDRAFGDFLSGIPSREPSIEMVIPSAVDDTISPPGAHVVLLFTQYTPYDNTDPEAYAQHVFRHIDRYAPGFSDSIVGYEVLTPKRLESEFNLTGGNIFHGAMTLEQSYMARPDRMCSQCRSPINTGMALTLWPLPCRPEWLNAHLKPFPAKKISALRTQFDRSPNRRSHADVVETARRITLWVYSLYRNFMLQSLKCSS